MGKFLLRTERGVYRQSYGRRYGIREMGDVICASQMGDESFVRMEFFLSVENSEYRMEGHLYVFEGRLLPLVFAGRRLHTALLSSHRTTQTPLHTGSRDRETEYVSPPNHRQPYAQTQQQAGLFLDGASGLCPQIAIFDLPRLSKRKHRISAERIT